jgi:hypothetical protein
MLYHYHINRHDKNTRKESQQKAAKRLDVACGCNLDSVWLYSELLPLASSVGFVQQ